MISKDLFDKIKKKYGSLASWAIFADESFGKPKSNMADISILNPEKNSDLLKILNPNIIMVGLNFSRDVSKEKTFVPNAFMNFHDPNPYANDFKIRYVFKDTDFYGAYMTDIIKEYPEKDSNIVSKNLNSNPQLIERNINTFIEELEFIGAKNPIILCFGNQVYDILRKYLDKQYYSKLIRLTHYSYRISKENYKKRVEKEIEKIFGDTEEKLPTLTK